MSKRDRLDAIARHVLTREGLSGFTMERLAEAAGVSRPTAYQHFHSKEGALASTATKTVEVCRRLLEACRAFLGSPRERAMAHVVGYELLAWYETEHFEVLEFLASPWVKENLPEEPLVELRALVVNYGHYSIGIMNEAVANGELQLPQGYSVELANFHTANFCHGIYLAIARRRMAFEWCGREDPLTVSRRAINYFWDGLGWARPDASATSEADLHDRILRRCFPEYWLRIKTEELKRGLEVPIPEAVVEPIPGPRSRRRPPGKPPASDPTPGPGVALEPLP